MIPFRPEYASIVPAGGVLGVVRYGTFVHLDFEPPSPTVATPPLAVSSLEVWRSPFPVTYGRRGCVAFSRNGDVLFGAVVAANGDLETLAERAYTSVLETIRAEGFPHLLRVWNYVRGINAGAGEDERYKRFCAGRHQALSAAGIGKQQFAAASTVGMHDGDLAIHFIAGRKPGRQVENGRQVSAYDYPPQYGLQPPSFSRATIVRFGAESLLFISGTASIVGHETRHRGDIVAQTEETLVNLEAVAYACGSSIHELALVKVYLRRPEHAEEVTSRLRSAMPKAKLMALHADICRADLLLEVEAIGMLST